MKTKRFTKLIKVLALFMFFACEKQEILQPEETQTTKLNFNLGSFEIDELPNLANEINDLTKSSKIGFASKSTGDDIVLDESRVLAVTDSVGNTTFSIRMYVPDTPYNVFHNVVLKQTPDGKMNEPFVLRYKVAEDYLNTYISSERKDVPFQGNLEVFSISSFIEANSKTDKNGTGSEPCFNNIPVNGSNGSGSGGSGGGVGNGNFGNTGTGGGFAPVGIVWSDTGSSRSGYVEVGKGVFGRPAPDDNDVKKSYSAKNGECPEDEMLIPINEEDDHVHLIDEVNNPCVKEILKKLQQKDVQKLTIPDIGGLSGTGHLSQSILDLFDKSGDYDITFKIEQLGTSNGNQLNGRTRNVSGGWEIKIDSDLVNDGTRLFIAKTIIHESTHAFIQYILGTNRTSDLVKDLNEIHKTRNDANLTQHEFMSQYVDALAHSLSVWDNHVQSIEYYKKLSWGGLETSDAYKAQTNKTDIQKAIQNERYNKTGAKGTKCN